MAAKGPGTVLPDPDGIAAHRGLRHRGLRLDRLEPLGGGYHSVLLRTGDVVVRVERAGFEREGLLRGYAG